MKLLTATTSQRLFPQWAMFNDEAPSLFWSAAEVARGALKAAAPAKLIAVFARLSTSVAVRAGGNQQQLVPPA